MTRKQTLAVSFLVLLHLGTLSALGVLINKETVQITQPPEVIQNVLQDKRPVYVGVSCPNKVNISFEITPDKKVKNLDKWEM